MRSRPSPTRAPAERRRRLGRVAGKAERLGGQHGLDVLLLQQRHERALGVRALEAGRLQCRLGDGDLETALVDEEVEEQTLVGDAGVPRLARAPGARAAARGIAEAAPRA